MISNRYKWGFFWIVWASILWGFSYVPQELVWWFDPLAGLWEAGGTELIEGSMIVAAMQALMFAIVLFLLWSTVNGKPKEAVKNLVHFPVSKWFLVSAFWGGLLAMFGSTLATAFIGADFSSAIALLSGVTGALYARVLFKEKLTKKLIVGLIITTIGGILICDPSAIMDNITNPAKDGVWLGYLGGIMSAIGWGVESCYNVRGIDVADTEATTVPRYFWEMILWFVIVMPLTAAIVGWGDFYSLLGEVMSNPNVYGLLIFTALSLGVADSLLHKGFPLMGVGRGLAVDNAVYVPAALISLWVFLKDYDISIWLIAGAVVAIIGTFVMYWEKEEVQDGLRDSGEDD